ncbi:zeta toxin family protein [Nonlabens antarcticus]|uniref:zeta toxin family protein n=1 Tax=Nonlabens antarcticus TaxID=392714 RepID=UPI0018912ACB|nr:zeta toxin family protein [Nonlabens antarcticus]
MKKLYVIAGCNGAGKTTASYTILPEILDCDEFINADEIAKGISPFNPDGASFQAGRIMLERIHSLIESGKTFAFETTLATKSYRGFIEKAQAKGYSVSLMYFYLNSKELAVKRVETRVKEGGHNISKNVILRRYDNGLNNFFTIFKDLVSEWTLIDNSGRPYKTIAETTDGILVVHETKIWNQLKENYNGKD